MAYMSNNSTYFQPDQSTGGYNLQEWASFKLDPEVYIMLTLLLFLVSLFDIPNIMCFTGLLFPKTCYSAVGGSLFLKWLGGKAPCLCCR